ncbi:hypothetical protein [Sphingobacterium detergens]|uniref:Uncharacterized protein n=1 Tax=Sphingobacterium detergens TaxID=1145106 RepID=A0A420ARS9_SPHD1|nr:hypothetical protein [Sphingobacterium detergens]RKE47172.1 hypothetical protein DFQ12_4334 [Sphingobacterium detergens]
MKNSLKEKLWAFITENNPDLMFNLQEGYSVPTYLEDKVMKVMPMVEVFLRKGKAEHEIEQLILMELTKDLRPSKYNYIKDVITRDFPNECYKFREAGVLTYECINMLEACNDIFITFDFNEDKEDHRLRHAIIARVHDYLSI